MMANSTGGQDAGDEVLIDTAKKHLAVTGARALLIRSHGEDFIVVAGPAETVFSLVEEDIEFYKHNVDEDE